MTHACMPGCVIQCSNVYHDASGKEVVSPVEYETLGLLGTNCGLSDPDDLAALNYIANDLGVDTIELGRHASRVLMEAGLGAVRRREVHGRRARRRSARARRRAGSGRRAPRAWASTTTSGACPSSRSRRSAPTIRAWSRRTGITMMATAQGADHTAGNLPRLKTREMDLDAIITQSLAHADEDRRQRLARALHLRP